MPPKRKSQKEKSLRKGKNPQKREKLLTAAADIFARRGYRSAAIDEIAAAAGVAKGTVYLYFASKEDLFFALLEQMTQRALAAMPDPAQMEGLTARAQIETIFFGLAADLEQGEKMIPLTLEFWSACGVEETRARFGGAFAAMYADFRKTIVKILKEGAASGEFHREAAQEEVASALMSVIDGLIVQQWADRRVRLSDCLRVALPVILRGLKS